MLRLPHRPPSLSLTHNLCNSISTTNKLAPDLAVGMYWAIDVIVHFMSMPQHFALAVQVCIFPLPLPRAPLF